MKALSFGILALLMTVACWGQSSTGTEAQMTLAQQLVVSLHIEDAYRSAIDHTVQEKGSTVSTKAREEEVRAFFTRYVPWSVVKDVFVRLYASRFTSQELKEAIAFLGTSAGVKLVAATIGQQSEVQYIISNKTADHLTELNSIVTSSPKENNPGTSK